MRDRHERTGPGRIANAANPDDVGAWWNGIALGALMASHALSLLVVLLLCAGLAVSAEPPQTVFTAEQAAAGQTTYEEFCIGCHMADLGGQNEALPLKGTHFVESWGRKTTRDLFAFVSTSMPPGQSILAESQYLGLVAYLLQSNGAPAGPNELKATTAVSVGSIVPPPKAEAHDPAR